MYKRQLETLAIVAYKQPATRAEVEAIRGVRCEYAISQLLKQKLIEERGRRDTVGRPVLFGTTDAFPVSYTHLDVYKRQTMPMRRAYSHRSFCPYR